MKSPLVLVVLALLLLPLSLSAQTGTWTAVASSGDIDEASLGLFAVNGAFLNHAPGAVGDVVARYNVTNTYGGVASDQPPWHTLELGYLDQTAGCTVSATLYEVAPCTGISEPLCVINSVDNAAPICMICQFNQQLNFAAFLYFVEVHVTKVAAGVNCSARTLRIY